MNTIKDAIYECVSTPRRSKIYEEETVIFAPDARKANKKQFEDDILIDTKNEFLKIDKNLINEDDNILSSGNLRNSIINIPRLSINTRFLMTPKNNNKINKNKMYRDSILSTANTRIERTSFGIDFLDDNTDIDNNIQNNQTSDFEDFFTENIINNINYDKYIDNKYNKMYSCFSHYDIMNKSKIDDNDLLNSPNLNKNKTSIGKKRRYSPKIHIGNDSPSELIRIMKKNLKLN